MKRSLLVAIYSIEKLSIFCASIMIVRKFQKMQLIVHLDIQTQFLRDYRFDFSHQVLDRKLQAFGKVFE